MLVTTYWLIIYLEQSAVLEYVCITSSLLLVVLILKTRILTVLVWGKRSILWYMGNGYKEWSEDGEWE